MPWTDVDNYNLLVAQNYLRAISKPSPEFAKKIAELNKRRNEERSSETRIQIDGAKVLWTVGGPSRSLEEDYENDDSISSPLVSTTRRTSSTRPREGSASLPEIKPGLHASEDDQLSQSLDARKKTSAMKSTSSKLSLMQKISRMISSDELIKSDKRSTVSFDSESNFPESPSTGSQFSFLKRIKSTITKGERHILYSSGECAHPLVVVSTIQSNQIDRKRKRDRKDKNITPARARPTTDRLLTLVGGTGELQPLEFRDDEELAYGRILKLRRPRLQSSTAETKKPAQKSLDRLDTSLYSTDAQSTHSLAGPSAGMPADADDVLTAQRHTAAEYDPRMISEVEAALRTTVRGNSFVATTYNCLGETEQRKLLNDRFRSKFPELKITYTKLRSIKREMVDVAIASGVDMCTVAHAFVYYERIVLQGRISKANRKEIAAACFIIAIKLCDPPEIEMKQCIEKLELTFRIAHDDLLAYELPVCLALSFDLMPPRSQLLPHYNRLQVHRTI